MRVTNGMMSNRLLTNINRNLSLLDRYNTQGATGKKIQVPSDDPIIASRSLKFRTMLSEAEQYAKNASDATSWIDSTEVVFGNINKILTDMKGLMTQGANATYTLEDRKKILTEYSSLLEQLEQELNTDYMGRNIFSGFRTDKKPIVKDPATGKNVLNKEVYGDPNAVPPIDSIAGQHIEIQVGAGITVSINSLATDVYTQADFNSLRGGIAPNGQTQFDRILDFLNSPAYSNMPEDQKLAWEKDPANDIRGMMEQTIKSIEDYQSKLSTQETDIGIRSKRVELVQTRLEDDKLNYKTVMSQNEDVNIAEVMMNFNTANAAYTASLNIGMKITQITLADYLR
ncbi:flagellar hook-associated protein FlgL [uncultured Tyzzerella sp.]|uniref:flagellar hook-associated protein FlgL n=1 Tax=uncultured Tyzzerella sp. TaxID=2321398 RepID=UPI002943E64B|nr:flagellar hook-associated protein FlgL [uncultured Tyzzerella sp.]